MQTLQGCGLFFLSVHEELCAQRVLPGAEMSSDDGVQSQGERHKAVLAALAEGRVMEGQTVLATKASPKTGNLKLSVMAGEHLAQLGSKQKKAWIGQQRFMWKALLNALLSSQPLC